MSNPAKPVQTATLTEIPMLSPHESLNLNPKRGLLAAVTGNPSTDPGLVSIHDVVSHGMSLSDDGNRAYIADVSGDMLILDVSQIQARKANPPARTRVPAGPARRAACRSGAASGTRASARSGSA